MNCPVYYTRLKTPPGKLGLFATPQGVCGLSFHEIGFHRHYRRAASIFGTTPIENHDVLQETADAVARYFKGQTRIIRAKVDLAGLTPFQYRVLNVLLQIPYGSVQSYQWVARKIQNPDACRAVGRACAANPVPVLIPCHRVISKDGGPGGYSAGTDMKKWLLSLERGL